jgi:DNA mismatch endonuclease, patch repair protein
MLKLATRPSPATSKRMKAVRREGTEPELRVKALFGRLQVRLDPKNDHLPGKPDLVCRDADWAIFIHGCFWHRHPGCGKATTPKTNRSFWAKKFGENVRRDRRVIRALRSRGYSVSVVWACQVEKSNKIQARLLSKARALGVIK